VKTIWLFALLFLLLTIGYGKVAGIAHEMAAAPDPLPVALAPGAADSGGRFPERFTEYMFLHQTREESIRVHTLAGMQSCSE
jgi:hypothetical protein